MLIARYRVIALFLIVGILLGVLASVFRPPAWESTSLLLVNPQPQNVQVNTQTLQTNQINPVISTLVQPNYPATTVATLGQGTKVAQMVVHQLGNQLPKELQDPAELLKHVEVTNQVPNGDQYVIQIVVTLSNDSLSQKVANAWAAQTVSFVSTREREAFSGNIDRIKYQMIATRSQLQKDQAALDNFERTSGLPEVSSELAQQTSLLNDYLGQVNQINLNLNNAALLKSVLNRTNPSSASSLPVLLLSLSSFTSSATSVDVAGYLPQLATSNIINATTTNNGAVTPDLTNVTAPTTAQSPSLLVQPTLQSLTSLTPQQQIQFVASLEAVLRTKQSNLRSDIETTQTTIGNLRAKQNGLLATRTNLVQTRDTDQQNLRQLYTLYSQGQITPKIQSSNVSVASEALEPQRAGLRGALLVILGALAGLVVGIIAAFVVEYVSVSRARRTSSGAQPTSG